MIKDKLPSAWPRQDQSTFLNYVDQIRKEDRGEISDYEIARRKRVMEYSESRKKAMSELSRTKRWSIWLYERVAETFLVFLFILAALAILGIV